MEIQENFFNNTYFSPSIDCLPEDNFQHILSYIPKLGNVALVCRKWNASAQVQHILQRKTFETIKEIAQRHYLMPAVHLAKVSELLYLFEIVDHHFSNNQCDEAFLLESEICRSLVKHITYRSVVFLNSLIKLDDRRFTLIIKLLLSANRHSEAKSLASHLENEAPKRYKKFILFIKEHKIYSYFKNNDWMLATIKINHLSRHYPQKAEKLSLKMIDLQQNKIDFIPIELFQYILSYVPGLFNASLVSKRWNKSVPAFLQFKFPEEKRNTLEYVNTLIECRAFSAAEIFYSNYIDLTYPESISKFEIFKFAINENEINFFQLLQNFENLVLSTDLYSESEKECAELIEKTIGNLYNNFTRDFDNNLNILAFYLKKFHGSNVLKPFCTHFYWPLFRECCKKNAYMAASQLFELVKNSVSKKLIWSCFSDSYLDAFEFFKSIRNHDLINDLLYSIIYSLELSYSAVHKHLDSFIFQFNTLSMLTSAARLANFPLLIKILAKLYNKNEINASFRNYTKYLNNDLLYDRFIENLDYNSDIFEFYFNNYSTKKYTLDFTKDLFWPLLTKASQKKDNSTLLKLINLLLNKKHIDFCVWDILNKNFSFEEITGTLFQISDNELKARILDSFFNNYLYSKLKNVFNLFLVIKHLQSINELKLADELTSLLYKKILSTVEGCIKSKKYEEILALKSKHIVKLYEILSNSEHYELVEGFASIQLSLSPKHTRRIIDKFLKNNKWDEARVLVYKISTQKYSNQNQEELLSMIDLAEVTALSLIEASTNEIQAQCVEFYEKEIAVKESGMPTLSNDYDEMLYDEEYDPANYSSGTEDPDMYGSGSDLSENESDD